MPTRPLPIPWLTAACLAALLATATPAALAAPGPRLEVAFVLDATGSMGSWIDAARRRISSIAEDLSTGSPAPEIRFALVSYRDKGDAYVVRVQDFDPSLDKMKRALNTTHADGGGDYPEAVLEAMEAGIQQLDWTVDDPGVVKLLYLVGDAPAQRYADSPDEELLLSAALQRGIVIHSIACGSMSSGGQTFFERVARLSEGRAFRLADPHAARAASGGAPVVSAAGASGTASLEAAVSGSARAYSGAVGVEYAPRARPRVAAAALGLPEAATALDSGLLGAHVRFVSDARTWTDLWSAHASVLGSAIAPPAVDFSRQQILVIGGADRGLELVRVEEDDAVRYAIVAPRRVPGPTFHVVPVGKPVFGATFEGGAR